MKGESLYGVEDKINIDHITYDGSLCIKVKTPSKEGSIIFESPRGFRLLDEADLLECWPHFSSDKGWFFKINSGGWLAHESKRNGFAEEMHSLDIEYFIAGEDDCISVIMRREYEPKLAWH